MKRREFITLLGAAAAWPLAAHAQQGEPVRRIGFLMNRSPQDSEGQARLAAFRKALQGLGWSDDRNIRIDVRWGEDEVEHERRAAAELMALSPEVILASGTLSVAALQNLNRTLPIVFAAVTDPVGAGFVDSLARPGGNATGFMIYEYSLSGKWMELLKQIAPNVTRAAVLRNPTNPAGIAAFTAIQAAGQSLGVEVVPVSVRDSDEIERALGAFARAPNGGMIVTQTAQASHRDLIITLAARLKLPAVYTLRNMVIGGGLISYGPDLLDHFRQAASYVDRVLKGEKPADLPVQQPTKLELLINLKTAKTLALNVPDSLLARADEVIE